MTAMVLVAYATRHGSTREVAEVITATLREHGLQAEMQAVRDVETLDTYNAVVLGAPLYMGHWHHDASSFLKRHRSALSERAVAIFALGPLSAAEAEWHGAHEQLDHALSKLHWLTPIAVEMFGGVIDPAKLHFPFHRMPEGDARNWTAIRAFADTLAVILQSTASSPEREQNRA